MESFEIKDLCSIHGKQGVFRFKKQLRNGIAFSRLIDPEQTVVVFDKDRKKISVFNNIGVYIKDQKDPNTLESVIETLYAMEDAGTVIPENLAQLEADQACTDTWPTIADFMEEVLPNYDRDQFKPHHMDKILKWYTEITEALNLVDDVMDEADIMAAAEANMDKDEEVTDPTTK